MKTLIVLCITPILLHQVSSSFFEEFDEPSSPVENFNSMVSYAIDDVSQKINCALATIKIALSFEVSPNPCSVSFNEVKPEPPLEVPKENTDVIITTRKVIHMDALTKEADDTLCKMLGNCHDHEKIDSIKVRLEEVCIVIITEIEKFSFETRRKFEYIEEELRKPTIEVIYRAIKLLRDVGQNETNSMSKEVKPVFIKSLEVLHLDNIKEGHERNATASFPTSYQSFAKEVFVIADSSSTKASDIATTRLSTTTIVSTAGTTTTSQPTTNKKEETTTTQPTTKSKAFEDKYSSSEAEFMPKTEAERKAAADEAANILAENEFDDMLLGEVASKDYKNSKNAFSNPSLFKFR